MTSFSASSGEPVEWRISDAPVPYPEAVAEMEARVAAIAAGEAPEHGSPSGVISGEKQETIAGDGQSKTALCSRN